MRVLKATSLNIASDTLWISQPSPGIDNWGISRGCLSLTLQVMLPPLPPQEWAFCGSPVKGISLRLKRGWLLPSHDYKAPLAQRSKMLPNLKLCEHQHVVTSRNSPSWLHEMTGNPNSGPPSIVPKAMCLRYILKTNEFTLVLIPNRSLYRYSKIPDTWDTSIPKLFGGYHSTYIWAKQNKQKIVANIC